jgi:hypothetical protein
MDTTPPIADTLTAALRQLSLGEVEQRLADLDAERAALSLLCRSLAARERARRRSEHRRAAGGKEVRRD